MQFSPSRFTRMNSSSGSHDVIPFSNSQFSPPPNPNGRHVNLADGISTRNESDRSWARTSVASGCHRQSSQQVVPTSLSGLNSTSPRIHVCASAHYTRTETVRLGSHQSVEAATLVRRLMCTFVRQKDLQLQTYCWNLVML